MSCFVPSGVAAKSPVSASKRFVSKSIQTRVKMHDVNVTCSDSMQDLHPCGLQREGLPKIVGGSYEINNANWSQKHLQFVEDNEW